MSGKKDLDEFEKAFANEKSATTATPKKNEVYKNFNFLQKEKKRLEKLKALITYKVIGLKKFSQISLLSIKEETSSRELKNQIINRALEQNSAVNVRLREIFKK